MKLASAIVRIVIGLFLIGFAGIKYFQFKDAISSGATTLLFNTQLSSGGLSALLVFCGLLGVAFVITAVVGLGKKTE
jgi:hypothetical protein